MCRSHPALVGAPGSCAGVAASAASDSYAFFCFFLLLFFLFFFFLFFLSAHGLGPVLCAPSCGDFLRWAHVLTSSSCPARHGSC